MDAYPVLGTTFACKRQLSTRLFAPLEEGPPSLLYVILLAAVHRGVSDTVRLFGNDAVYADLSYLTVLHCVTSLITSTTHTATLLMS